jgi:predicted nucleic acid-binding protein
MSVIANATVISNFAAIRQLELLRHLFERLYISAEVHEEIQAGLEEGYDFYIEVVNVIRPFTEQGWIELETMQGEAELRLFGAVPAKLHRGEASPSPKSASGFSSATTLRHANMPRNYRSLFLAR